MCLSEPSSSATMPGLDARFYDEALDVVHGFLERIEEREPARTIVIAKGYLAREHIPRYLDFLSSQGYPSPSINGEMEKRIETLDDLVKQLNEHITKLSRESNPDSPVLQQEYTTLSGLVYHIGETVNAQHRHPAPSC